MKTIFENAAAFLKKK